MHIYIFSRSKAFWKTSVLLAAACISVATEADTPYAVSGSAYSLDNNQLLYRELYTPMNENREVAINYTKPDGSIFATKVLRYIGDPIQPEFEYHDQRDNERQAARFSAGRLVLVYDQEGYKQEKEIMETLGLVVDTGFDAFIQQNWDQLVAGKKLRYATVLPTRLLTANLQVRQITADKSPLFSADAPATWRYFVIERANRFASVVAEPVHLAYESKGKYLMRYHGRSAIDNHEGDAWDVRIEYEYWQ